MEALLIHPKDSDQLATIRAILKALKVPYEPQKEVSFPKLTKKDIDQAYNEHRDGKYTIVEAGDLWK